MLRANAGLDNLRILLPMISSPREVDEVRALIDRAQGELLREGRPAAAPSIGVMVEVPSAIYQMDALARRADFFSIGTNDLTQYVLAVDRNNPRIAARYDFLHPAVLRAIAQAVRQANHAGKPIGVCGDMAGDTAGAILLLGMGIRNLSMASSSLPRVKRAIRTFTRQRAEDLLTEAIELEDPQQVHVLLDSALAGAGLRPSLPGADVATIEQLTIQGLGDRIEKPATGVPQLSDLHGLAGLTRP